jgi:ERF superfamily
MTEETKTPTMVERLVAVQTEVGAVGKGDRNNAQGFNFRGIDAVLNAVSGPLRKHGVLVYPRLVSLDKGTASTAKGSTMNTVVVTVDYIFTDGVDKIVVNVPGEAFDSGDKAVSKAMSVAYRTALIQTLSLPTDEPDPDIYSYEEVVPQKTDDEVIAEFDTFTDVDELKKFWAAQRVNGRSKAVQDKGIAKANSLKEAAEATS